MATDYTITSPAAHRLTTLEHQMLSFGQEEQDEIANLRVILRELIDKYDSSAKLAIVATGLEIAISEGQ